MTLFSSPILLRAGLASGLVALVVAQAGCPADAVRGQPELPDTGDTGATDTGAPDTTPDTEDPETDATSDDATSDDADAQDGETVELTEPGRFILGEADLDDEFVFKGVWAGEAGRIVAVGNDGVVATRTPEGAWTILTRAEGALVLNAVHGHDGQHLWAVGHNGAILPGTVDSFGQSGSCEQDADCADNDQCTADRCIDNVCVAEPTGAPGCCGTTLGSWSFDPGTLSGWAVNAADKIGPWTWQPVAIPGRAVSGEHALYFGNPAAVPPTYDAAGVQVAGSVSSPAVKVPLTGTATLKFAVFLDAEPDVGFDNLRVEVSSGVDRIEVWSKVDLGQIPTGGFVEAEADLTSFRGKTIQIRITFDSSDGTFNTFEGPYLDDIRIDTSCTAGGSAASSNGPTLWGVYAFDDDVAYAVGRDGTILTWNGETWGPAQGADPSAVWNNIAGAGDQLALVGNDGMGVASGSGGLQDVTTGTDENLNGLFTHDGTTWFGVGDKGVIVRGTGTTWTADASLGLSANLRDVHGRSNSDVYAVGHGGTCVHWDGAAWSTVTTDTTINLLGVWVDDAGLATAVGKNGIILTGTAATGLTTLGTFYSGGDLNDLWGTADGVFMVAVGTGGRVMMRQGAAAGWEIVESTTSQSLEAVWGTSASELWAVGRSGTAIHWDGTAFVRAETPASAALNAVWGNAADRYYAVGSGGTLLVWTGASWEPITTPALGNLRHVSGRSRNDVWAVGANGLVTHFAGLGWGASKVQGIPNADGGEDPITEELHAVWAAASDDAWAVGQDGRILHWDGTLWNIVETDWTITLRGIYGLASNDIWAVGNEGHVLHWNGEAWEKVETGSIATLYAIHGDGQGHVIVVGDLGTVLELERD